MLKPTFLIQYIKCHHSNTFSLTLAKSKAKVIKDLVIFFKEHKSVISLLFFIDCNLWVKSHIFKHQALCLHSESAIDWSLKPIKDPSFTHHLQHWAVLKHWLLKADQKAASQFIQVKLSTKLSVGAKFQNTSHVSLIFVKG